MPLHLLGFEPTAGITTLVFGIVGLGFALATLRLIMRQVGAKTPTWVCILAGFTVSLSSIVPFPIAMPAITIDTLAGGYCFSMAGVWLGHVGDRRSEGVAGQVDPDELALRLGS